jgi:hypothetical protein
LPGIAAALASYSERLGFAAQAQQYERMRLLFRRADELLPNDLHGQAHQIWQLYRQLGIEALKESADWVAIYRQRPIKPIQ